jgi:hypothetical protein
MPNHPSTCAGCGGPLQEGTVLAPTFGTFGNVISPNPAAWYAGAPAAGICGATLPEEKYAVAAYRCSRCSRLELYAR